MALQKGKLINPNKYLVTAEAESKTRFKQNPRTGQMIGRRSGVSNSDMTRNIRAKEDIEIDGKPGISNRDFRAGQILGRLGKGESKPSQIQVTSHYRDGHYVGHSVRKLHKK